ncbi:hypothetical protein FD33_GL001310 [Companilactobacillus paralimentarius DSM 13238 = JCM 10415]|jgi:hypothetical protein|uniref:Uncharacterized protein n=1 Tax=Companilactobacillus paralimentarius DSM 13238 = JCM 10415 TaxID=1122151 RepID=A0A0R1PUC7_9LACO|nr:hypothetical protein [Companilactobacillus paralimentarius]KAE9565153.1 hypothetical protein ATN96_04905 [Companilactobacillus paralimentarius]KRL31960.1 hypothetical protein FD33_GL001310 [Companilactobacillus paralimentarius DSM 13238 = JCM 10415]MDR4933803.1 hypothetical protein [Companilactobacillus paralimentarius]QFR70238.1 hypothetical protein LP238_11265 [Companilactobacillus paralimentarius]
MIEKTEFGKKINRRPLIVSLLLSLIAGGLGSLFNLSVALSLFLGILFLLIFIYYPSNLPKIFGHWQLEKHGVSYYKLNSYPDRLKLIFLPDHIDYQFISFSQVKKCYIIENNKEYDLQNILTIKPTKQSFFPWLRKPFYLVLDLNKGKILLDLSWDQQHDPKNTLYRVSNVLKIITEKIS